MPIYDFAKSNEELAKKKADGYYSCCGKTICKGCIHSFNMSGNIEKCPFCNSTRSGKTDEDILEEIRKCVEANDAASIYLLANFYHHGSNGLQQDQANAIKHYAKAAELGFSYAHKYLGNIYHEGGELKKAKFHFKVAAMAGDEEARANLGLMEAKSGNMEQAVKHWTIAASAGERYA